MCSIILYEFVCVVYIICASRVFMHVSMDVALCKTILQDVI